MNETARFESTDLQADTADVGCELHALVSRLFPICRSITGEGVRQTIAVLSDFIDIRVTQIPSGTQVFVHGTS